MKLKKRGGVVCNGEFWSGGLKIWSPLAWRGMHLVHFSNNGGACAKCMLQGWESHKNK